jgi:hypothetical protein
MFREYAKPRAGAQTNFCDGKNLVAGDSYCINGRMSKWKNLSCLKCWGGGIGIRASLRNWFLTDWEFKSPPQHFEQDMRDLGPFPFTNHCNTNTEKRALLRPRSA